ncbi:unnamed protein product [Adineta ricciae]|uniref:Uncharacterized protein n=1 Tax=Adineta ricciae TaxID=249248 RepID=A0A814Q5R2_ADIRI|nr:unnamed protein product [Adineta ricciae]CAF1114780.1 unnamed protein product [Adineta ricciae]
MSSSEKGIYRLIPYRFFINGAEADVCKLEKLTNLFPDLKAIIELESFKFNNLNRMIERLSQIYSVSTVIDIRDDTYHVFLGPYHLSLGPAIFGAFQFKNISTALLTSSSVRTSGDNTSQSQKRRHEAVLRRFRRAVRKLILIKSMIDKLQLASILTPYNQYELYSQGIYDLVLAGHLDRADSALRNESFIEQVNEFRSMINSEKEKSFVASRFMKINALLQLISPSPNLHQTETTTTMDANQSSLSNASNSHNMNDDHSEEYMGSVCCPQHAQDVAMVRFTPRRSLSYQSSQFLTPDPRSRLGSTSNSYRKKSLLPRQNTTNSLPDLGNDTCIRTNTSPPSPIPSPPFHLSSSTETSKSKSTSSTRMSTKQDDAFISNISTLLTTYASARQSSTTEPSTSSNTNEFDELLLNIKTLVDEKLATKTSNDPHVSSSPELKVQSHRKNLFSFHTNSLQQTFIGDSNEEQLGTLPIFQSNGRIDSS